MGLSLIIAGSGSGGATEVYTQGLYQRTSLGTPKFLFASTTGDAAAVRFSTPRLQGATAGYQVTAGKTLIITKAWVYSGAVNMASSFGYSDSDRGFSNAADGLNPVGLDSGVTDSIGLLLSLGVLVMSILDVYFEIPAGKFPRVLCPIGVFSDRHFFLGHEV